MYTYLLNTFSSPTEVENAGYHCIVVLRKKKKNLLLFVSYQESQITS